MKLSPAQFVASSSTLEPFENENSWRVSDLVDADALLELDDEVAF